MADTTRPLLKTAIIYDFDGTLARGNMQEVSFIPSIGMTPAQFWNETVRPRTIAADGDGILMYMQMMLLAAREQGNPVTRRTLQDHGRDVALFEGLRDGSWFDRMNEFGAQYGLEIEHYIISAGLEEMIQGCPIAGAFTRSSTRAACVLDCQAKLAGAKDAAAGAAIIVNSGNANAFTGRGGQEAVDKVTGGVAKALGVPPFALSQLTRRAGRRTMAQLKKQLALCVNADFDIKRGAVREEAALDRLMLALTEK